MGRRVHGSDPRVSRRAPVSGSEAFLMVIGRDGRADGRMDGWSLLSQLPCSCSGAEENNHAKHHEDVPQRDEDAEVPEAQQKLPNVVACAGFL